MFGFLFSSSFSITYQRGRERAALGDLVESQQWFKQTKPRADHSMTLPTRTWASSAQDSQLLAIIVTPLSLVLAAKLFSVTKDGHLLFQHFQAEDSGKYSCTISYTKRGVPLSQTFRYSIFGESRAMLTSRGDTPTRAESERSWGGVSPVLSPLMGCEEGWDHTQLSGQGSSLFTRGKNQAPFRVFSHRLPCARRPGHCAALPQQAL